MTGVQTCALPIFLRLSFASWLAAALGTRRIPGARPDWPEIAIWATAAGTAMLVGGSLVLHEAAHALVARAYGARDVVLRFALAGGAVTTDARQLGARGVAATAIAGPLANAAITLVTGGLALSLDPDAPTGGLLWGTPVTHDPTGTSSSGGCRAIALRGLRGSSERLPPPARCSRATSGPGRSSWPATCAPSTARTCGRTRT